MNRRTIGMCLALMTVASADAALPRVDTGTVSVSQDVVTRLVTITYELRNAAGVVTLDIQTNAATSAEAPASWVSIGARHFSNVAGDVNRLVTNVTGTSQITWQPLDSWPNHDVEAGKLRFELKAWEKECPPDYLVCNLVVTNEFRYYTSAEAIPFGVTNDVYKTEKLVMRKIPAANVEWRMGSPLTEVGRSAVETPHMVRFTEDYYIGIYPLTQKQYVLMNPSSLSNPSRFKGDGYPDWETRPVEYIRWNEIRGSSYGWPESGHNVSATHILGKLRAATGLRFDLPTEAQWEYACRAGNGFPYGITTNATLTIDEFAWQGETVGKSSTNPVGKLMSNAWGLYDMHGNVDEWCLNYYGALPSDSEVDPEGPSTSADNKRTLMGGGWSRKASTCRSASRWGVAANDRSNSTGFRVVCPVQ